MRKSGLVLASIALAVVVVSGVMLLPASKPARAAFPGGNGKIVFESRQWLGPQIGSADGEIYTVTPDGKRLKRLTDNAYDEFGPAFSSDGKRIAFSRQRFKDYDVHTMNTLGTGSKNITRTTKPYNEGFAAWSPDGTKVVFEVGRDLYVIDADGTNSRQLTAPEFNGDGQPSWSPDGTKILFSRSIGYGVAALYVMNADGTDQRLLSAPARVDTPCVKGGGAWSPDGTKIVFVYQCRATEEYGIYTINADGSGQKRLSTGMYDIRPRWSPDGQKVVFVRPNEGFYDLFVMRADGINVRNITNTPEISEGNPSWQPRPETSG